MLGLAVALGMLCCPLAHLVADHKILRPGHAATTHEIRHRQRPMWLHVAASAGWLAYLAAALGLVLS